MAGTFGRTGAILSTVVPNLGFLPTRLRLAAATAHGAAAAELPASRGMGLNQEGSLP
jgi:hypothetical protein